MPFRFLILTISVFLACTVITAEAGVLPWKSGARTPENRLCATRQTALIDGQIWTIRDNGFHIELAQKAWDFCERLELCDLVDWRLPSVEEWLKIIDPSGSDDCGLSKPCPVRNPINVSGPAFWITRRTEDGKTVASKVAFAIEDGYPEGYVSLPRVLCLHDDRSVGPRPSAKRVVNPNNPAVLFNQAVQHLNGLDDDKARPFLEQCLAIDPEFPECLYQYGVLLLRRGELDEAKAYLNRYLKVDPDGVNTADAREVVKYL